MLDEEFLFRGLLDGAGNSLPVLRSKDESAEDQEIERALEQFKPFRFFSGRHSTRACTPSGKMSTQNGKGNRAINASSRRQRSSSADSCAAGHCCRQPLLCLPNLRW